MCSIDGCDQKTWARGLCLKHYTRLRRNGDPLKTNKRGPKPDGLAVVVDQMFPDWDRGARARYLAAWRLLNALGVPLETAISHARRGDGSINVTKVRDYADRMVFKKSRGE